MALIPSFSNYFQVVQTLFCEGGNVRIVTADGSEIQADKIDLTKFQRSEISHELLKAFHALNRLYEEKYGEFLWPNPEDINTGHIFNGSSEHFFNPNLSDEEFVRYKKTVGDIDVTVPSNKKQQLFDLLNSLRQVALTDEAKYLGSKQTSLHGGHQINSLIRISDQLNVQVDFEFLKYEQNKPSKFAKFSHSSDWEDIKQGYKGVLHKYLLQSLAGGTQLKTAKEVALFTAAATKVKPRIASRFPEKGLSVRKFSIDRGLRKDAYSPYYEDGELITHDNKPVYKETPTDKSTYETDPLKIANEIFGNRFEESDLKYASSFVGLIRLSLKYLSPIDRINVFEDFFNRLFGLTSQGFERNNPQGDFDIKKAGYEKLRRDFKITSYPSLDMDYQQIMELSEDKSTNPTLLKVKKYYENYRMTGELAE